MKVGDLAPNIIALDQSGEELTLNFPRKKKVILFFYPKDNTEGCIKEVCSFRDHYSKLKKLGFELYGINMDSPRKHSNFIKKFDLPFTLISDPDKKAIEAYGCWALKKFMGREYMGILRTTFVIDVDGTVLHRIDKVETARAAEQVLVRL